MVNDFLMTFWECRYLATSKSEIEAVNNIMLHMIKLIHTAPVKQSLQMVIWKENTR